MADDPGSTNPVTIRILGKEYQVACAEDERQDLLDSAQHLNDRMRQIRDQGKVVGLDRIAVMAALNLANEVLGGRQRQHASELDMDRIRVLNDKLDLALARDEPRQH
ncbi:MAG TPA: cell division protein ZapA [Gammaproteobacteria bacterium]|nr:cell division protein ZapA [Gammaproteobacteria bacterium]